jgi:SAM-dependent methyltransferase
MTDYEGYHKTRVPYDERRAKVWKPLARYLQPWVGGVVVDIGCGHADFLRFIEADRKLGLDIIKTEFFPKGAKFIKAPVWDIAKQVKRADTVFASNLFEHLSEEDLDSTLAGIHAILPSGGRLIIMQPNFKHCAKDYFDDYTHKRIFTHVSLADLLAARGFRVVKVVPKFLPFSMRSRLPTASWLVALYLRSPIRPMAGQMLIIAEKP